MTAVIHSEDFDVTPAISDYLMEQVDRVSHFCPRMGQVDIYLHKETKGVFNIKMAMHLNGHDYLAEEIGKDLYAAAHRVREKLVRQLSRTKGRFKARRHRFVS